jgi:selenocysteine lyase/cysteine desulfurase
VDPRDTPPAIDERPDTSTPALQALRGDFRYFNVAGSGPTFPVAQRAAERFRAWLNEVGMFGQVGYAAYNAALDATRADIAAALGDPGGAARIALAQSATDGLNTLIAGLVIPPGSLIVTTAEEHGSALYPLRRRMDLGDKLVEIAWHRDPDRLVAEVGHWARRGARALVISLVSCKTGDVLPVAEACRVARDAGAITIVDAAQALGQLPVDVRELGADAIVTLGHKWLHGPLATGAFWVRDLELFTPTRLGWRSRLELPGGSREYNPNATRFETGTVDAAAFVGLRQTLVVHRLLGAKVPERVRALRERLLARLAELPFAVRSTADAPTGIVVVEPRTDDVAELVTRMWDEERMAVKLIDEPGIPQAIRISFWALHQPADLDELAAAFARQLAVRVP